MVKTKSGLMVGLGETEEEIYQCMEDLRRVECSILTIGQYLRPSKAQIEVKEFIAPDRFKRFEARGKEMGFEKVFGGPYVRSSYKAEEFVTSRES